jgi:hypothetical protein
MASPTHTSSPVVAVTVYALVVTWLGRAVAVEGYPVASFLAAGTVAVLFEPLRRRLQRLANRLAYGARATTRPPR